MRVMWRPRSVARPLAARRALTVPTLMKIGAISAFALPWAIATATSRSPGSEPGEQITGALRRAAAWGSVRAARTSGSSSTTTTRIVRLMPATAATLRAGYRPAVTHARAARRRGPRARRERDEVGAGARASRSQAAPPEAGCTARC
jgi:hypothetical protein